MHLDSSSNYLVTDYGENYISVNGRRYAESIVISTAGLSEAWHKTNIADLNIDDFAPVLQSSPEIVILGTGTSHVFPAQKLMADLYAHGCALEVMTTSAACRTYNVLAGEYRKVTAVLLQIGKIES